MESNIPISLVPSFIIHQAAARADTPEPLVLREASPQEPKPVGPKRFTISGKRNHVPYAEGGKRRVIFNKTAAAEAVSERHRSLGSTNC